MLYTGDQPGADIGPMISPAAKQRAIDLVESGVKQGAELILDGRDVTVPGYEKGNFFGPTILAKVQVGDTVRHDCRLSALQNVCIHVMSRNVRQS